MKNKKALIVFSGGQDSTTCLFWAKKYFKDVEVVTFQYGQRHATELEAAQNIASSLRIPQHIVDLRVLSTLNSNALTSSHIPIEEGVNGSLPSTFVPGRNLLFLSFAAIVAKNIGAQHIVTGVCETDFSGYPDCRDSFIKSLNVTINLSMDENFIIHTPLMWLNKAETWQLADELGALDVIINETVTCYNGVKGRGCTQCPACTLRQNGFQLYMKQKTKGVHTV